MQRIVNPKQTRLFDSFDNVLTEKTRKRLLDEPFCTRYAPGVNQLFGAIGKDSESRRLLRRQVAEDMYLLIRRFADAAEHTNRNSYKSMERIFYEQCEVHEEKVCVKNKTGGNVMQNPSDPGATYDGHKEPGYQVQLSETCHPDNVNMSTNVRSKRVATDIGLITPPRSVVSPAVVARSRQKFFENFIVFAAGLKVPTAA